MGCALPGPLTALCKADIVLDREVTLLGRLRNVLQALVFRHRSSSVPLIVRRYASRPLRRSSVSSGEEVVRVNHDFDGNKAGGGEPA